MRKKARNFAKWMIKRQICLSLAVLLSLFSLFSFAGCGQTEDGAASPSETPFSEPNGAPYRAVYPISEIRLSFPGGSGTVRYRYAKERRSVERETVLRETDVIPGAPPKSAHTLESYLFNSDGRLESYLLEEVQTVAAMPDGENGEPGGNSSQNAGNVVEMTVKYPLFKRQFFYMDGRLNAVTEENLQTSGESIASDAGNDGGFAGVKKRFLRDARGFIVGAILSPMESETADGASNAISDSSSASTSTGAVSGVHDLPSDGASASSDAAKDSAPLLRERYDIGEGGLPMYIYGASGDAMGCIYTLSGRSVVGRQLNYAMNGKVLWTAKYSYSYDDSGRIVRIDWTISYPGDADAASGASSGDSGTSGTSVDTETSAALPEGMLLPGAGSYSMTIAYAEDQPTYLAAACEELRLGSLEQGYSADGSLRLLAPSLGAASDEPPGANNGEKE